MWAHEHWNLEDSPDIVTFSKKMQIGGFFYKEPFRPDQAFRIFNTWLGDPSKLVFLEAVVKTIKEENLIQKIAKTGDYMLKGLEALQTKYPKLILNARGRGTFCAIDFSTPELRDKAIKVCIKRDNKTIINFFTKLQVMHSNGVHCGGSGSATLRVRTTLTFNEKHVDVFLNKLDISLNQLK